MGPLVNKNALEKIDSQVKDSIKEGAEIITGGKELQEKKRHISINLQFLKMSTQICALHKKKYLVLLHLLL